MKIRVLPEAEAEILAAVLWYEERQAGLGVDFYDSILAAIKAIGDNPRRFPRYEISVGLRDLQRAIVKRFPYLVIFEVREDLLLIIAIAHSSRLPGYWSDR